jgi:hypothetical protein
MKGTKMGDKTNFIIWLVELVIPTEPTLEKLFAWAKRFTVVFLVVVGVVGFLFAAAADHIPGFDGFARHSEVTALSAKITATKTQLSTKIDLNDAAVQSKISSLAGPLNFLETQAIETAINNKIRLRCTSHDAAVRAQLSSDIQTLEDKYYKLSGYTQGYQQPSCFEVGAK